MSATEQSIQQELIQSVPISAHDAVLFRLGSLQGVVSVESYPHSTHATIRPVVTVYDPNDDLGLKAVVGSAIEEIPDLDEEQRVQALVIDGVSSMVANRGLHDATTEQVQASLEGLAANAGQV